MNQGTNPRPVAQVKPMALAPAAIGSGPAAPPQRLAALAGVKAEVSVVAGRVQTTVGEILGLQEGAVLEMDSPLNAPCDVVLDGTVIARGELVVVGDRLGLRLTQVQAAER